MKKRAFTLIELLVVIAIISILASILFPVFSRARAKGRQAACISNQKQIVMAILMYAEDYDELIPYGGPYLWYHAVYPYTHNYQIFYCPDRKDRGPGYALNYHASGISLGQVWDAASKILIGDVCPDTQGIGANPGWPDNGADPAEWWLTDPGNDVGGAVQAPDDNSFTGIGRPQRHNDGVVYGFVDGHVKWARERQLDQPKYWIPSVQ